jgi:branched-chain amino acid transport system ATP-binding protein
VTILEARDIRKAFGGVIATDGVSLSVEKGELRSIIGPNGAGKTTLFNLLTGHIPVDSGTITFNGRDITRLRPHVISSLGVGRSFQRISVFPRLTVFENVQVSALSHRKQSFTLLRPSAHLARQETLDVLDAVGLANLADRLAATLPHGDQKRLEVGIALALAPELLLLDEPTAGMSPEERVSTIELVGRLVRERGLTLLFTEHDMDIVFSISQRITVLHQGRVLAEGKPAEIRANALVQKVYLGES